MQYAMVIEPMTEDEGGGFFAFFPDLPGCASDGDTVEEAARNGMDAFRAWMEVQKDREAQISPPGSAIDEAQAESDAMARTIARLTGELEAARARVAALEAGRASVWQPKTVDPATHRETRSSRLVAKAFTQRASG